MFSHEDNLYAIYMSWRDNKAARRFKSGEKCILWNSLILCWAVISYPFMPTRHDYWMPEHNHVPAKRLEAIQPCCRYISRALILLTCCLCSIVYPDEVANLCASIFSLFILSVPYVSGDVALSRFRTEKGQGEHKF
jgi:hypothetical protein